MTQSCIHCGKPARVRSMCDQHYQRWKIYGNALEPYKKRRNGEGWIGDNGYQMHSADGRRRYQHHLVAEAALGRQLPVGAVVHHVDGNKTNNAPTNLVVCPSSSYHQLIHQRERALDACGNANHRQCWICKQWSAPADIKDYGKGAFAHYACYRRYQREYRAKQARTT